MIPSVHGVAPYAVRLRNLLGATANQANETSCETPLVEIANDKIIGAEMPCRQPMQNIMPLTLIKNCSE